MRIPPISLSSLLQPARLMRLPAVWLLAFSCIPAFAQVTVYTDRGAFESATGASEATLPDWSALDADASYPENRCSEQIVAAGDPAVTMSAPNASASFGLDHPICICGPACLAAVPSSLLDPKPGFPVVAANGPDDYVFDFDQPVMAFGLELVTDEEAAETLTLYDEDGEVIEVIADGALGTAPNSLAFVGVVSATPIYSALLETGASSQNEGFYAVLTAGTMPTYPFPLLSNGCSVPSDEFNGQTLLERVVNQCNFTGGEAATISIGAPEALQELADTLVGSGVAFLLPQEIRKIVFEVSILGRAIATVPCPPNREMMARQVDRNNPAGGAFTQFSNCNSSSCTGTFWEGVEPLACDLHDSCYEALPPLNLDDGQADEYIGRLACDGYFRGLMRNRCEEALVKGDSAAVVENCEYFADLYFVTVRTFGWCTYFGPGACTF